MRRRVPRRASAELLCDVPIVLAYHVTASAILSSMVANFTPSPRSVFGVVEVRGVCLIDHQLHCCRTEEDSHATEPGPGLAGGRDRVEQRLRILPCRRFDPRYFLENRIVIRHGRVAVCSAETWSGAWITARNVL